MKADSDLPWYFGLGPSTAAGDMGLRSSFGTQLDMARAGVSNGSTITQDSAETDMHRRLGAAHLHHEITARLERLSDLHRVVLSLHYGGRPIVDRLSGAAVLTPEAALLTLLPVATRDALCGAVRASLKARDGRWLAVEVAANELVRAAVGAYEDAQTPRRRKVWGT